MVRVRIKQGQGQGLTLRATCGLRYCGFVKRFEPKLGHSSFVWERAGD